jgi:hypothetical protein
MSFSDFGGGASHRAKVSSHPTHHNNNNNNKNQNAGAAAAPATTGSLAVISETLVQYQVRCMRCLLSPRRTSLF